MRDVVEKGVLLPEPHPWEEEKEDSHLYAVGDINHE